MENSIGCRYAHVLLAVLCAFALMLLFLVAESTQAEAKISYKKISVVSKIGYEKIAYNKYGLVAKISNSSDKISKTTYKYSGAKIKSFTKVAGIDGIPITQNGKIVYNKKGRLCKQLCKMGTGNNLETTTFTTDKSGRVTRMRMTSCVYKISYDKKSRISKLTSVPNNSFSDKEEYVYKYDGKENVKVIYGKFVSPSGYLTNFTENYVNTYKSGKLVKRQYNDSAAVKITYKTIKIPTKSYKKYADAIKKQQKALFKVNISGIDSLVMS